MDFIAGEADVFHERSSQCMALFAGYSATFDQTLEQLAYRQQLYPESVALSSPTRLMDFAK